MTKQFLIIILLIAGFSFSAFAIDIDLGGIKVNKKTNTNKPGQTYDNSVKGAEKVSYDMKAYLRSQFENNSVMVYAPLANVKTVMTAKYGQPIKQSASSATWSAKAFDEPGRCGELTAYRNNDTATNYHISVGICD